MAPANANAGSARKKRPAMPVAMATTAPTAPPADTPMIPGSAIGLRNSPCIVAPATPRAMPTEAPTTIRGSLICSMTSCSVRPKSTKSSPMNDSTIEATWLTGMLTGPRLSETSAVARISRPRIEEPIANRVLTPDWRYPSSPANPTALNENDLQAALRWRSSFALSGIVPGDRGTLSVAESGHLPFRQVSWLAGGFVRRALPIVCLRQ